MRGASPMEHGAADFPQVSDEEMSLQQWALHTATANSFVSVLARASVPGKCKLTSSVRDHGGDPRVCAPFLPELQPEKGGSLA